MVEVLNHCIMIDMVMHFKRICQMELYLSEVKIDYNLRNPFSTQYISWQHYGLYHLVIIVFHS